MRSDLCDERHEGAWCNKNFDGRLVGHDGPEHVSASPHRRPLTHRSATRSAQTYLLEVETSDRRDVFGCSEVRFGSKPEVAASIGYVRSTPESGLHGRDGRRPLRARLGHQPRYSITSSARSRIEVGISMPIALAARRLTAVSNFVDCSTGTSSGFAPERTLSTR